MTIIDGRNSNAVPTTLSQDQFDALLPQQVKTYSPEHKASARVCIYKIGDAFIPALYQNEILTLCAEYKTERGAYNWVVRNYPHATEENNMNVKINLEWLEQNVFNHHPQVREIIAEHNCTGAYQYDVNVRGAGKYGVRVGFFDKRLYRGKFFVTPTEGNYQMVAE